MLPILLLNRLKNLKIPRLAALCALTASMSLVAASFAPLETSIDLQAKSKTTSSKLKGDYTLDKEANEFNLQTSMILLLDFQ